MAMIRGMATGIPIGTRIAKRRQQMRLTQEELAQRLGVSKTSVTKWETGTHFPKRHLGAIEEVLGIDLSDNGEPAIPTDPEERALWEALSYMDDPAERWRVIGAVRQARDQAATG